MRSLILSTGVAVVTVAALMTAPTLATNDKGQIASGHGHKKVNICHATGSKTNPYVFMSVDSHAVKGHTHHHDGHDKINVKSVSDCGATAANQAPSGQQNPMTVHKTQSGQVLSTTVASPAALPHVGATGLLGTLAGLSSIAAAAAAYLRSRQSL